MKKLIFSVIILLVVSQSVYSQRSNSKTTKNKTNNNKGNTVQQANLRYTPNQTPQNGQVNNVKYNPSQGRAATTVQNANVNYTPNQAPGSTVNVGYSPGQSNVQTNSQQGVQTVNTKFNPNQTNPSEVSNGNPLQYNPNNTVPAQQVTVAPNNNPLTYSPNSTGVNGQSSYSGVKQASTNYVPAELTDVKYFVETNPDNVFKQDVFDKSYYVVRKIQIEILKWGVKDLVADEVDELMPIGETAINSAIYVYKIVNSYKTGDNIYHIIIPHK